MASAKERLAVLKATQAPPGEPLFGAELVATRASAYLKPGTGTRSLVTLPVPTQKISFDGGWRVGELAADLRVRLPLPGYGERWLPLKDHHLLMRARTADYEIAPQVAALTAALKAMGELVAVGLGLSRPFQTRGPPPGDPRRAHP